MGKLLEVYSNYSAQLVEIGASSGERIAEFADNPLGPGQPLGVFFSVLILVMQLARTWIKKPE